MKEYSAAVVGMDLGDRRSELCALNGARKVVWRRSVKMSRDAVQEAFEAIAPTKVIMEAGTHSMWVSELLNSLGHEVIVANPRALGMIYGSNNKNDRNDAELLARLGLADEELLSPITHRDLAAHADLAMINSRYNLVAARTALVNAVRGTVKVFGERLRSCSTESFHKLAEDVPVNLRVATAPLFASIQKLSVEIKALDKKIEILCDEKYPETKRLRQIRGVGPVTALVFVLVIEDPRRFQQSRQLGPYVGLVPKQDQSGKQNRELRITKAGHRYLRTLLLQCAHYILGRNGEDCDLRAFGLRLFERGGKYAKARAAVALARKLAVLMHRLWVTGDEYDPHFVQKLNAPEIKTYKLEAA